MSIEKVWQYDGVDRQDVITKNIMGLMVKILGPLAKFLAKQQIENGDDEGKHAAPPFRRYDWDNKTKALEELTELIENMTYEYDDDEDWGVAGSEADVEEEAASEEKEKEGEEEKEDRYKDLDVDDIVDAVKDLKDLYTLR